MIKKTFEISNIKNDQELNTLSIALNDQEQVSHIKVGTDNIVFNCIDIEALFKIIYGIQKDLIIKEVIDGKKRNYDFAQRKERKQYFMFKNVLTEDDLFVLEKAVQKDSRLSDAKYDIHNKILTLVSSYKDVLSIVKKELYKINPSIEVFEHKKPIRSEDVFQQKYIGTYVRLALFFVLGALAIIMQRNHSVLTPILWLITIFVLSENLIKKVVVNIRSFQFFKQDVLTLIAMILGVVSGAYVETCVAVIIYQCSVFVYNKSLELCLNRIDNTMKIPETGKRYVDDCEEVVSLYDFKVGDVLVVYPKEIITIPGIIVRGKSHLNTYTNTSIYELKEVVEGMSVHSGDVNAGEEALYVQITEPYESSNFVELMNIASVAPVYESKVEKLTQKLSYIYTPVMVIIAMIVGIILPIIDYTVYKDYVHVGAILFLISAALMSEQSTSLGMLAGFAKAFKDGIVVESSKGLDSLNATQTIVYDRFDSVEVNEEELELFKKLSHIGKKLVIFNDGPVALENDQYKIYNDLSVEQKLKKMDKFVGPVVYIGDSFKDLSLLQKSYVGISRGGLSDSKVVENSDIVLIDSNMDKVYETFSIARKIRSYAILNHILAILSKLMILIGAISLIYIPLWLVVVIEIIVSVCITRISTFVLK